MLRSIHVRLSYSREDALNTAYTKYKNLQEGSNADYIPALAKVDPTIYRIALVTPEGKLYTVGGVEAEVSIQSISKVFTMALVMGERGPESLFNTMGVDATGQVFKSEAATNQRNQTIASLMYAYDRIEENPARATDIYTEQCSVNVNARRERSRTYPMPLAGIPTRCNR